MVVLVEFAQVFFSFFNLWTSSDHTPQYRELMLIDVYNIYNVFLGYSLWYVQTDPMGSFQDFG